MILANDDRPRTMHAEAERTERHLLPEVVADLLQRQDERRRARRAAWRVHLRAAELWSDGHERMACRGTSIHSRSRCRWTRTVMPRPPLSSDSAQNSSQACDSAELRVVLAAVGPMARPTIESGKHQSSCRYQNGDLPICWVWRWSDDRTR